MKPSPSCGHRCLRSRRPGACLPQGPRYNSTLPSFLLLNPTIHLPEGPPPGSRIPGDTFMQPKGRLCRIHTIHTLGGFRPEPGPGPGPGKGQASGRRGLRKAPSLGECSEQRLRIMGKPGDWEAWCAWLWGVRARPGEEADGHTGLPPTPNMGVDNVYGAAGVRAFGKGSPHIPAEGRVTAG